MSSTGISSTSVAYRNLKEDSHESKTTKKRLLYGVLGCVLVVIVVAAVAASVLYLNSPGNVQPDNTNHASASYVSNQLGHNQNVDSLTPAYKSYNNTPRVTFDGSKDKIGKLARPTSVAVDHKINMIYVVDGSNERICKFLQNGTALECMNGFQNEDNFDRFVHPTGIAVSDDGSGELVISDCHRVIIVSRDFILVQLWGNANEGNQLGQFKYPHGLAYIGRFVYVADLQNYRIQILNRDDPLDIKSIEDVSNGGLVPIFPYDVTLNPKTNDIIVVNYDDAMVFNSDRQYLRNITAADLKENRLGLRALSSDQDGNLFIVDDENLCVHIVTVSGGGMPAGQLLYHQQLGKPQLGNKDVPRPGCFQWPSSVAINGYTREVYVTDWYRHDVQIFLPLF